MTSRRPVVAAFDVDRTVTTRDCVVPFLRRVAGTFPFAARMTLASARILPAVARGDRDRAKEDATRIVFAGRRAADVDAAGEEFADRRGAVVAAARHARPAALAPGVGARGGARVGVVHGLPAAVGAGTSVSTACSGPSSRSTTTGCSPVRSPAPTAAASRRCAGCTRGCGERHGDRANVEVWAYGDSPGDRELLADADHAVWVRGQLAASSGEIA